MLKKTLLVAVLIAQLTSSCSGSDDDSGSTNTSSSILSQEIEAIVNKPYSQLEPKDQKVKLEVEANDMLTQMEKSKTSGAIEAIQNLGNLLDISTVDIFNGKNDNGIEEILNVSGVYGIYTWNNSQKIWIKTASTTELKFVFPAKKGLTTNNAVLSSKSTSSTIKVEIVDTRERWTYTYEPFTSTVIPEINDEIYLPTSVDATLTIDNAQAATFILNAKYTGTVETPDESSFKMVLNDGYTWEISGKKAAGNNVVTSSFTYNGKNLISFNSGSTANIDELMKEDALIQYQGKANGLATLMDNFVVVADMDIATSAADEEALEKSNPYPDYPSYNSSNANYKAFYIAQNAYYKKDSEGSAANFNKNMKLILVSKKDGTKIADLVQHSEKDGSNTYPLPGDTNETFTHQYYTEVTYLKFGDGTEVEMSAYFSEGFETLETKFEDFLKAFER